MKKEIVEVLLEITSHGIGIVKLVGSDGSQFRAETHQAPVSREYAEELAKFLMVPLIVSNIE